LAPWRLGALCVLFTAVLVTACQRPEPVTRHEFLAFGTLIEVSIAGVPPDRARAAAEAVEAGFERWHHDWHAWEPGPLTELNAALAGGEWVGIPAPLRSLIPPAIELSRASGGLFNPTIGRLLRLWGFQGDPPAGLPPAADSIATLVAAHPSVDDLELDDDRIRSRNPAVQLDFGAFAKGFGIDLAMQKLAALGIRHAVVNAGGDLKAMGRHPDRAWRIGIRDPDGSGVTGIIEIRGLEAVFTSGDYERKFERDGKRYSHIIDPRTGRPARATRSITVVHAAAATADAAATALFVAGDDWPETAARMGVDTVLRIDAAGRIQMTPAMHERLQPTGMVATAVEIVPVPATAGGSAP